MRVNILDGLRRLLLRIRNHTVILRPGGAAPKEEPWPISEVNTPSSAWARHWWASGPTPPPIRCTWRRFESVSTTRGVGGAAVDGFSHQPAAQRRPPQLRGAAGTHGRDHAGVCHGPGPGGAPRPSPWCSTRSWPSTPACAAPCCASTRASAPPGTPPPASPSAGGTSTGSGPGGTSPPPRATPWRPSATCTNSAPVAKTWPRSPSPPAGTRP